MLSVKQLMFDYGNQSWLVLGTQLAQKLELFVLIIDDYKETTQEDRELIECNADWTYFSLKNMCW